MKLTAAVTTHQLLHPLHNVIIVFSTRYMATSAVAGLQKKDSILRVEGSQGHIRSFLRVHKELPDIQHVTIASSQKTGYKRYVQVSESCLVYVVRSHIFITYRGNVVNINSLVG